MWLAALVSWVKVSRYGTFGNIVEYEKLIDPRVEFDTKDLKELYKSANLHMGLIYAGTLIPVLYPILLAPIIYQMRQENIDNQSRQADNQAAIEMRQETKDPAPAS